MHFLRRQVSVTAVVSFQWPAVHPDDAGVYICQAENSEGITEVKVEIFVEGGPGVPVASVSPRELTAVEGHTVILVCQASGKFPCMCADNSSTLTFHIFHVIFSFSPSLSGSPPPVITWSKLRAPLPWKHTVSDGVLTLTNIGRQDSGQYICNATNVHGYSEAYTQMEVDSESTGRT